MEPVSLYLHIPFCEHRCGYCDFNTYAGLDDLLEGYIAALSQEVRSLRRVGKEPIPIHTIFFGGGTPSLVPVDDLKKVFDAVNDSFCLLRDPEITLEVNPGTVDLAYLEGLRSLGVNRLSMGVQSADKRDLEVLERRHGYDDAVQAVGLARQAGFGNISLDLIYGVPYQTMDVWQKNVKLALELNPQHLSLYALTVEHGTPLEKLVLNGDVPLPDPDLAADMYEWTEEYLAGEGFGHYEISNWAREDKTGGLLLSRHNLQYWLNQTYIGAGAGAHGFINGRRTMNVLAPGQYIERFRQKGEREFPRTAATISAKQLDEKTQMEETMMMGLRLLEIGVTKQRFSTRFGVEVEDVFGDEIDGLVARELLVWVDDPVRLVLTQWGRLLGNQVFMEFV